jgi:hypothetical protein
VPPLLSVGARLPECRVKYTLATRLVNKLVEAADERKSSLTHRPLRAGGSDLPIDELDKMELDPRGAELLFQVLTEHEEKNSIAIAANESFSGWTKTFTDPRLGAAIVDRLMFNGSIIETGTDSYRLAKDQRTAGGELRATRHEKNLLVVMHCWKRRARMMQQPAPLLVLVLPRSLKPQGSSPRYGIPDEPISPAADTCWSANTSRRIKSWFWRG